MALRWFDSPQAFFSATSPSTSKPALIVLDGVIPRGEEANWFSTLLRHPDYKQTGIIMLSEEFEAKNHQAFMDLGATDHLIKLSTEEELKAVIGTVCRHAATR